MSLKLKAYQGECSARVDLDFAWLNLAVLAMCEGSQCRVFSGSIQHSNTEWTRRLFSKCASLCVCTVDLPFIYIYIYIPSFVRHVPWLLTGRSLLPLHLSRSSGPTMQCAHPRFRSLQLDVSRNLKKYWEALGPRRPLLKGVWPGNRGSLPWPLHQGLQEEHQIFGVTTKQKQR